MKVTETRTDTRPSASFRLIKVPGDGDCFYHAFSEGIKIVRKPTDGPPKPLQLRSYVAEKLLASPDLRDDLLREWVDFRIVERGDGDVLIFSDTGTRVTPERVARRIERGEWATATVIHILAVAFQVEVAVVQRINGKQYTETFPSHWKNERSKKRYRGRITLLQSPHHFDLLVPAEENTGELTQPATNTRTVFTTLALCAAFSACSILRTFVK